MKKLLLILVTALAGSVYANNETATLINARLALMKDVAAYKWHNEQPIEDFEREQVVLEKATFKSLDRQITVNSSRNFFRAQIAAAKEIQSCWFKHWQQSSSPTELPDLIDVIRPQLLQLGDEIIQSLETHPPARSDFMDELTVSCLREESAARLYEALAGIRRYPSRLMQIRDSGVLRVGTTGDYAPFSFALGNDQPRGIDITLAERLAAQLDVELRLVKTSWPGLSDDFKAGRFDIAMSGVSITAARRQFAAFSMPYHIGGKTPITRCERVGAFSSLKAIDKPGTLLIVNPGGTNEKFLDTNIKQATKLLYPDNRTIFQEIVEGRADLMITDSIEVRLKSSLYPDLCPAMPGETLTYQEKGYMLPAEPALVQAVNDWLQTEIDSGFLQRLFTAHLNP